MSYQKKIYEYLKDIEVGVGGYTGKDVSGAAKAIDRPYRTVRRWIDHLIVEDPDFAELTYLGKREPIYTSIESEYVKSRLQQNCLLSKKTLLEELNEKRAAMNMDKMTTPSFYRWVNEVLRELDIDENDPYRWLKTKGLDVTRKYNLKKTRKSINELFSYRGLKNRSEGRE